MYFLTKLGSNYTPSAQKLKVQDMPPRKKKKCDDAGPIGPDGKLRFPPLKNKAEIKEEQKILKKIMKKNKGHLKGIVTLEELQSGEYWRKKKEEELKKQKIKERKIQIDMDNLKRKMREEEGMLAKLQAELPTHPDVQKRTLLDQINMELCRIIREEDIIRIQYYLTMGMEQKHIPPYDKQGYNNAKLRIPERYKSLKDFEFIQRTFLPDLIKFYEDEMRLNLLKYILKDPTEWTRLSIETFPFQYPITVLRAPVPWHTQYTLAKEKVFFRWNIGNVALIHITRLWDEGFKHMLILPTHRFEENESLPLDPKVFEAKVKTICEQTKNFLIKDWLGKCADILLKFRSHWKHKIPKKPGDSIESINRFFNCVNCLLSLQVRRLTMKSLQHFLSFITKYKDGNDFDGRYSDNLFINIPLLKITAKSVLGTKELHLDPPIDQLRKLLRRVFTLIISVNENLPRIENIIFPEFREKHRYLTSVTEAEVSDLIEKGMLSFEANIIGPEKHLVMYEDYYYILLGIAKKELLEFFNQDPFPYLKDFMKKINHYDDLKKEIISLRRSIPLNMLSLECGFLNDTLYNIIDGLRQYVVDYFVSENYNHNRRICDTFDEMSQKVSQSPETVPELVSLMSYVAESRDVTLFNLREKIRQTAEYVLFLMDCAILSIEDINLNCRVFIWPKDMENVIQLALQRLNMKKDQAEIALKNKIILFDAKLAKHQKQLEVFKKKDPPVLTIEELEECVEMADAIVQRLQEDKQEAELLNEEEQYLDMDTSPFLNLYEMLNTVDPYAKLWHTAYDFHVNYDIWFYGPFAGIDADEVIEEVESMWRTLYKLGKTFTDNPAARRIAETVKAKVEKFKQFSIVLQTICNPGLQERHWEKISEILGAPLIITPETTLSDMIEAGLPRISAQLEEIGAGATKEYALETNLKKMKEEWIDITFDCILYRDTGVHILSAVDDIQVLLDDHILKAQTMKGSPYIKALEEEMNAWEEKLLKMQDIIEAWLTCQATWMYLEPIFSSEDIMRQMPTEARNFKQVDKIWRLIMNHTILDTHVLVATELKNMLPLLKENNLLLDEVQKGLNDYLEKKRLYFPRFFFLSNDELLEILSETKDPLRVQPHLKKCFEGIFLLEFTDAGEVIGMISSENEIVPLSGKIIPAEAKGMVEKWLLQVQHLMIQSMKDLTTESVQSYADTDRKRWILNWPGQIVQCVDCIMWTSETIEAIKFHRLKQHVNRCNEIIQTSVNMVKEKLEPGSQVTVEALIVIDVHSRDVVKSLDEKNVRSIADFDWISQMRYYFLDKENSVNVCMITTTVAYGFEYLGNIGRLVITPLTDRCFRTLMGALKLNLGGAPEGPAGTGKTESCKDLAKAVAKKCVVFNCSEGLDYKALGKFFKGLAQSGSWACFDEFNRIELEVLSVVAQQILSIQMAVASHLERFIFEGTEITLDPTCTVFITMNPGYAGRVELPDNLKVLFRTVAMMVPDYAMIGEISLYSYGFSEASSLSQKIVHTYKLCSEQLSSQNHYDYGMRAVKSVLLAAGALKKAYGDYLESQIVLRAIIDVNMPKFLAQDVPLFEGIYSDLFPGVELPKFERDDLLKHLSKVHEDRGLQGTPWFVGKCLEIYEMILVRHGLMVVGETLGGKTSAYQSLGEGLSKLSEDRKAKLREYRVIFRIINPKAISLGRLYGQFDPVSHEWSDGVLATTFREYAMAQTVDRKWILFDGPVDAVWIESMNTVLDDNKKLCLMSGEIIQKMDADSSYGGSDTAHDGMDSSIPTINNPSNDCITTSTHSSPSPNSKTYYKNEISVPINCDEADFQNSEKKSTLPHYLSTAKLNIDETLEHHNNLDELNKKYRSSQRLNELPKTTESDCNGLDNPAYQDDENVKIKKSHDETLCSENGKFTEAPKSGLKDEPQAEAVNLELINLKPNGTDVTGRYDTEKGINGIPTKKDNFESTTPYDEYFVPVNEHRKYMRGEKLYVTKDKREKSKRNKCLCWSLCLTAVVAIITVGILAAFGVIGNPEAQPIEEGRNFGSSSSQNSLKTAGGLFGITDEKNSSNDSVKKIEHTQSPPSTTISYLPPSTSTPQLRDIVPNTIQAELKVDNLQFTPELQDKNSSEFKELSQIFEKELKSALFSNDILEYGAADISLKVIEFLPGSVIVKFRIGWVIKDGIHNAKDPIDKDILIKKLQRKIAVNHGYLANFRIIGETIIANDIIDLCKTNYNNGCEYKCSFNYKTEDFICECPSEENLQEDGKSCEKQKPREVQKLNDTQMYTTESPHQLDDNESDKILTITISSEDNLMSDTTDINLDRETTTAPSNTNSFSTISKTSDEEKITLITTTTTTTEANTLRSEITSKFASDGENATITTIAPEVITIMNQNEAKEKYKNEEDVYTTAATFVKNTDSEIKLEVPFQTTTVKIDPDPKTTVSFALKTDENDEIMTTSIKILTDIREILNEDDQGITTENNIHLSYEESVHTTTNAGLKSEKEYKNDDINNITNTTEYKTETNEVTKEAVFEFITTQSTMSTEKETTFSPTLTTDNFINIQNIQTSPKTNIELLNSSLVTSDVPLVYHTVVDDYYEKKNASEAERQPKFEDFALGHTPVEPEMEYHTHNHDEEDEKDSLQDTYQYNNIERLNDSKTERGLMNSSFISELLPESKNKNDKNFENSTESGNLRDIISTKIDFMMDTENISEASVFDEMLKTSTLPSEVFTTDFQDVNYSKESTDSSTEIKIESTENNYESNQTQKPNTNVDYYPVPFSDNNKNSSLHYFENDKNVSNYSSNLQKESEFEPSINLENEISENMHEFTTSTIPPRLDNDEKNVTNPLDLNVTDIGLGVLPLEKNKFNVTYIFENTTNQDFTNDYETSTLSYNDSSDITSTTEIKNLIKITENNLMTINSKYQSELSTEKSMNFSTTDEYPENQISNSVALFNVQNLTEKSSNKKSNTILPVINTDGVTNSDQDLIAMETTTVCLTSTSIVNNVTEEKSSINFNETSTENVILSLNETSKADKNNLLIGNISNVGKEEDMNNSDNYSLISDSSSKMSTEKNNSYEVHELTDDITTTPVIITISSKMNKDRQLHVLPLNENIENDKQNLRSNQGRSYSEYLYNNINGINDISDEKEKFSSKYIYDKKKDSSISSDITTKSAQPVNISSQGDQEEDYLIATDFTNRSIFANKPKNDTINSTSTESISSTNQFLTENFTDNLKPVVEGYSLASFSTCSSGQFHCQNGTSIIGGNYCISNSDKCDSVIDCTDGSDEIGCVEQRCGDNFQCRNGECLKRNLVCDGIIHCSDNSDEEECDSWKCNVDEFSCGINQQCIPLSWKCDRKFHCFDGSDEQNCHLLDCEDTYFHCTEQNSCIPASWRCNGLKDCKNGEDEKLCECSFDQFQCATGGGCIEAENRCDGIPQCPDLSDEWNCLRIKKTNDTSVLEVLVSNNSWNSVCSEKWNDTYSNLACQNMGYAKASSTTFQTPAEKSLSSTYLRIKSYAGRYGTPLLAQLEKTDLCDKTVSLTCEENTCGNSNGLDTSSFASKSENGKGQVWPSLALLFNRRYQIQCTANIITPTWVLASYACLNSVSGQPPSSYPYDWDLLAGGNNFFDSSADNSTIQLRSIQSIIPHPQAKYSEFIYLNNVALVQLTKSLNLSQNVSAICLAPPSEEANQYCITVGWNMKTPGDSFLKNYLRYLPDLNKNKKDCNSTNVYNGRYTSDLLCVDHLTSDQPCEDDQGAPLMCFSEISKTWELRGLLTLNGNCNKLHHPSLFTDIHGDIENWIENTIGSMPKPFNKMV